MDKEQTAIERLKAASDMSLRYYESPLVITDSGGKDSSVCTALAERAGIPFEVMHNHTSANGGPLWHRIHHRKPPLYPRAHDPRPQQPKPDRHSRPRVVGPLPRHGHRLPKSENRYFILGLP